MSQQCSYDLNHDDNDDNGDNDDDNGYTDDDNGYNDDDDVDDDDNGYNNDDDDNDDLFAEVSGVRSRTLCRSLTSQGQPDFACRRHRHLDQQQGQVGDDHHHHVHGDDDDHHIVFCYKNEHHGVYSITNQF